MTISFDIAQLSGELAALRAHPHARTLAVVVPVDPQRQDMTRAALAEGPPFDPRAAGLARHEVILTSDEAVFLFELAHGPRDLDAILASEEFWSVVSWWEHIATARPRLGVVAYSWSEDTGEGTP
jgi:hypothetical protein